MILSESFVALPSYMIRSTNSSLALNSADVRLAFGFFVRSSFALKKVHVYFTGVTGSPTASNIVCTVRGSSDPSGLPGPAITNTTLSANPVVGVNEFTFTPEVNLNENQMYWLLLRNANSTPTSSYVTVLRSVGEISFSSLSPGPGATCVATSTDAGTTWAYAVERVHTFVLEDTSGTRYGWIPFAQAQLNIAVDRLAGYRFTPKVNMTLVGATVYWASISSNTNATLRLEVWDNTGSNMLWAGSTVNAFRQAGGIATYQSSTSFTLQANKSYIVGLRALTSTASSDNIAGRTVAIGNNPLAELGMQVAVYNGTNWQFFNNRTAGLVLLVKDLQSAGLVPGLYRGVW